MKRQLIRFLIIGSITVLVDLATYAVLLWSDWAIAPAKALAFISGTVFAYFANREWTFAVSGGWRQFAAFCVLYLTSLGVNVGVNHIVLLSLGGWNYALQIAFLVATGVSASCNFFGMRNLVFNTASPHRERTS